MADEIKVQVNFTANTKYGSYGDSLYFTEDEWANLTDVQLESKKQDRINKWVDFMDKQPPANPLTKAQLQAQVDALNSRVTELKLQIAGM